MDNKAFLAALASKSGLELKTVQTLSSALIAELGTQLRNLNAVDIPGFGTFTAEKNSERVGVDPVTKECLLYPPCIEISFSRKGGSDE